MDKDASKSIAKPKVIYTLEGRGNVLLDVIKSRFNLTHGDLYREINLSFDSLITELNKIHVNYPDLKNALVPNPSKREIALVFDSRKVGNYSYGQIILDTLIPLFEPEATFSVLCGDLIGQKEIRAFIRNEFFERINTEIEIDYQHNDFFFIVYINNLSDQQLESFKNGLRRFRPYVGYFDMTFSSPLKTYLSTILIRLFIKFRKNILTPNESTQANCNFYGYAFENNGYKCYTVEDLYYGLFLSFKIERESFREIDKDNEYSINSITGNVLSVDAFELIIEQSKLEYLVTKKKGNMERSGFHSLSIAELSKIIKIKLNQNYFYNLEHNKEYDVLKFNVNIETQRTDKDLPMKMLVSLEYKPNSKILRLITMY